VSAVRDVTQETLLAAPTTVPSDTIAYGPLPLQVGELRLPTGRGRVPVLVVVHGGCWLSQYDRTYTRAAVEAFTRDGWATWTIAYRRVGDEGGGWPGTLVDVGRAVDHVRVLAAREPRLDTTRVVVAGHSAGGHLALWVGSRRPGERLDGAPVSDDAAPLRVHGVLGLAAITDLAGYAAPRGCGSVVRRLLGGEPAVQPARLALASPVARLPLGVRTRLVVGDADRIVPPSQGDTLVARAAARGERIVQTIVPGATHFDVVAPQSVAWPAVRQAARSLLPR
jgi:acetyl esterase/lipase